MILTQVSQLLKLVKNIELKTKSLVEGMESGSYRSKFRGGGIEFSEVREYVQGDDVRRIDWNVSARHNSLFVKEFVEEKELNVYVIVDISASNEFGFEKSKKDLIREVAASIMYSATKNNDRVGTGLFTENLEKFIPAKKGKQNLIKLLHQLIEYSPKNNQTNISKSLLQLHKILKKHSLVFIVSDFISDSFLEPLKFLKKNHDVVLVNVSDLREHDIPKIGNVFLEDFETGEQVLVDTSSESFQTQYNDYLNESSKNLNVGIRKLGIDMINVNNEEPFELTFSRHFNSRRRWR